MLLGLLRHRLASARIEAGEKSYETSNISRPNRDGDGRFFAAPLRLGTRASFWTRHSYQSKRRVELGFQPHGQRWERYRSDVSTSTWIRRHRKLQDCGLG